MWQPRTYFWMNSPNSLLSTFFWISDLSVFIMSWVTESCLKCVLVVFSLRVTPLPVFCGIRSKLNKDWSGCGRSVIRFSIYFAQSDHLFNVLRMSVYFQYVANEIMACFSILFSCLLCGGHHFHEVYMWWYYYVYFLGLWLLLRPFLSV